MAQIWKNLNVDTEVLEIKGVGCLVRSLSEESTSMILVPDTILVETKRPDSSGIIDREIAKAPEMEFSASPGRRAARLLDMDVDELMNTSIEHAAEMAHNIWSHWMKYFIPKHHLGRFTDDDYNRWERQMHTPYSELTEKEKESDRKVARSVFAIADTPTILCDKCGQEATPDPDGTCPVCGKMHNKE